MFSAVLKGITGSLERRFVLTLFFPSLLFWGALLTVIALTADIQDLLVSWNKQSVEVRALQIGGGLIWVVFFAHVVSHHRTWLTRQFEGYWDWPLGDRLRRWRTKRHVQLLGELAASGNAGYERIYYAYPLPNETEQVMPTRLGNILKNAELYPLRQYEADAVLLWPRLYAVLPESFVGALADTKASLDLMLILSALGGVFAVVAGGAVLVVGGPWWLFLACFAGALTIAHAAYISGLRAAIPYAQFIKSAFDLYRGDLAKKMGYTLPTSHDAEIAFWRNLGQFIYRGIAEDPSAIPYKGSKQDAGGGAIPNTPGSSGADGRRQTRHSVDHQKTFAVVIAILLAAGGCWFLRGKSDHVGAVVAARDVPAYTRISPADVKSVSTPRSALRAKTLTRVDGVIGTYVSEPLSAGEAIRRNQLVEQDPSASDLVQGTVAVPLEVTAALALGGKLRKGEVVAVWDRVTGKPVLDRVLVLDVVPGADRDAAKSSSVRFVVVLAVPVQRRTEFLAETRGEVVFTRVSDFR
jgi:Flp pilus assembly protein CpaB